MIKINEYVSICIEIQMHGTAISRWYKDNYLVGTLGPTLY